MEASFRLPIPEFVRRALRRLMDAGHPAYVVGGAVRDGLIKRETADWDVATSASSQRVRDLFAETPTFVLRDLTVTLLHGGRRLQITSFRDPGSSLRGDLSRREFTINAMAYDPAAEAIIDPWGGRDDLQLRVIRAVNDPAARFREDPVRLLRAVRLATELSFAIHKDTLDALCRMSPSLKRAAPERVREELIRLLACTRPSQGLETMVQTGLLSTLVPELMEGHLKQQGRKGSPTILDCALAAADAVEPDPVLRLAALFHDVAKPRVRCEEQGQPQFPEHETVSAQMASAVLERLRFSRRMTARITHLIRHHGEPVTNLWSDPELRRFIHRVGSASALDILQLQQAEDRVRIRWCSGEGSPATKTNWAHLKHRVSTQLEQGLPFSAEHLAVDGNFVMEIMGLPPGPEVGQTLNTLLDMVMDRPGLNTREQLKKVLVALKDSVRT